MNNFSLQTLIFTCFLALNAMFSSPGCEIFAGDKAYPYIRDKNTEKNRDLSSLWTEKIFINEWVSVPGKGEKEWIELLNKSNEKINLSGWMISDNTDKSEEIKKEIYPMEFLVIEPSTIILNNDGDKIILWDSNNNIVDIVEYGDEDEVEAADYPYSMGRIPSSGKLTVFNNPTRGLPNSEDAFTFLYISAFLTRESINPLNGDTLGISLKLNCPGNISIKILNQYGRDEKNILNNALITAKENLFYWDGMNENMKYVNNGIYICYIIATQEKTNKKIEKKLIFNVFKPSQNKKTGCIITKILNRI